MSSRRYILYMHTSPSGKVYIGITCKTPAGRWGPGGNGYKLSPHFWKAICKYGWDNIKHEILLTGLTKEEACEKEREYIKKYRSNEQEYGYNMTDGGDAGFVFTDDVRKKLSSIGKQQWERMTPEERMAVSERSRAVAARRTAEETKAIRDRAKRTHQERYTPEQIAERYKRIIESGRKTLLAKHNGSTRSPEQCAAISERMKRYWEEYRTLHPKQKKKRKYRAPKVTVKLTRGERLAIASEAAKKRREELESRKKATNVCRGPKGKHWNLSEETKEKMRKPKSEETRRKMSEAKKRYFANMTLEQKAAFASRTRKHNETAHN